MKIRTGFVSNSSSSSFVIAAKGDLESNFTEVLEGIKTTNDFPMKELVADFMSTIVGAFVDNAEKYTLEEYLNEFCYDGNEFAEQYPEIYDKVKNHGWKLYEGSVSDQDYEDMGAMMLVGMEVKYSSDVIIIDKDAWY